MRFKHLAFPLILALAGLSGCTALQAATAATTGTISSLAPAAMLSAKKGLTAAHLAHEAAADGLIIAAKTGVLHGSAASTAKVWLDQSESYLIAADAAAKLGDAPGIQDKISSANTLIAKVQAAIGGGK